MLHNFIPDAVLTRQQMRSGRCPYAEIESENCETFPEQLLLSRRAQTIGRATWENNSLQYAMRCVRSYTNYVRTICTVSNIIFLDTILPRKVMSPHFFAARWRCPMRIAMLRDGALGSICQTNMVREGSMSSGTQSSRGDTEGGDNAHISSTRSPASKRRPEKECETRSHLNTSNLRLLESNVGCTTDIQCRQQVQLLALFETIGGLGTWEIDPASRKLTFSDNLCRLLGYPTGTHFKEDDYWSMVHPVDRDEMRQIATLAIYARTSYEYAARIYATDRSVRWHIMSGLPLTGDGGKLERIIGVYRDITDEARSHDEMRKLSQQLMHARDAERRHMARELHESAGQTLAALKMNLARLDEELPEDCEKGHEIIRSSRELADAAVREVRTISYLMHPPMLDEAGLNSALRWFARGFSERSKIRVDVEISDDFGRQPQEIETTIFRVVQEALTNVHRYSGSRTASIRLRRDPESICVEIEDAGCGMQFAGASGQQRISSGVGIAAMRERIEELEGTFDIESAPGRGTTIRTVLPLIAAHGAPDANSARNRIENMV